MDAITTERPRQDHPPPLRILEVVDTLDSGGMERQLVALMNRLDPARHHFEVCCLRHEGVNAANLAPGITIHALRKKEGFQTGVVRQMRRLLRRGFDVVHSHNLGPLIYSALATLGGTTVPIFHGEHSQFTPSEFGRKRVLQRRLLYRCCRAVHTVSWGQKNELVKAGVRHPQLTALVNGVNTGHFTPAATPEEREALRTRHGFTPGNLVIGIVARFGAFKRHLDLISTVEQLSAPFPNLRLLMVGDGGPCKDEVLGRSASSPVARNLVWAGYQSDPAACYQTMDLLVVPSQNEGLSNATLEAMACAVPVLTNTVCGAREIIPEDGLGGWVCDLGSVEKLTGELKLLLSRPVLDLTAAGAEGRRQVAERFSWSGMAENYSAWFSACAGRTRFPESHPV